MVKRIDLSKNRISYIINIFQDFPNLNCLDLSENFLETLNLDLVTSSNQIKTTTLNLHGNLLNTYNETDLNCTFQNIDLSSNNLSIIKIITEKSFFNLSGNNMHYIRNSGYYYPPNIDYLDLSSQYSNMNPVNWDVKVLNLIKLNNNKIPKLSSCCFVLHSILYRTNGLHRIDLSNSTISNIEPSYFSSLNLKLLNLSYNVFSILEKSVFSNSSIDYLDLSFGRINIIEERVFDKIKINALNLSHNDIENIRYVFDKIDFIDILDLSFNNLSRIDNFTFYNIPVRSILLGFNKITFLESKTFINLLQIHEIVLTNNEIKHLGPNTFYNLPEIIKVDLTKNHIETVQANWFYEMPKLRELLLTGNNLKDIFPISNQIQLDTMSLSLTGTLYTRRFMNYHLSKLSIIDSQIHELFSDCFDGLYNLISLNFDIPL